MGILLILKNLPLRARFKKTSSPQIGQDKFEIRSTKFETISNDQNSKINNKTVNFYYQILIFGFGHLNIRI